MNPKRVVVKVPGSTSNIGPGFDCLGLAVGIHLMVRAEPSGRFSIERRGTLEGLKISLEEDFLYQGYRTIWREAKPGIKPPPLSVVADSEIPVARGLGSSAAAIVAGLVLGNAVLGNRHRKEELLRLATDIEGHPDNVSAAIYGGLVASARTARDQVLAARFNYPSGLRLVVAIPDCKLETKKARSILPRKVPLRDAVHNLSRVALLLYALTRKKYELLRISLEDRLHQPYRMELVPSMRKAIRAAYRSGARGAFVSGSGPTVIALSDRNPDGIGRAMVASFGREGISCCSQILAVSRAGYSVKMY